jgi:hypothetical protein
MGSHRITGTGSHPRSSSGSNATTSSGSSKAGRSHFVDHPEPVVGLEVAELPDRRKVRITVGGKKLELRMSWLTDRGHGIAKRCVDGRAR